MLQESTRGKGERGKQHRLLVGEGEPWKVGLVMRLRQEGLLVAACSSVSSRVPTQTHAHTAPLREQACRMMPGAVLAARLVQRCRMLRIMWGQQRLREVLRTCPGEGLVQVSQLRKLRSSLDGLRAGWPRLGSPNRLYPLPQGIPDRCPCLPRPTHSSDQAVRGKSRAYTHVCMMPGSQGGWRGPLGFW
jgi:hypothetical protein